MLSVSLLLEMALSADPDRLAVAADGHRWTVSELSDYADGGAGVVAASGASHVVYIGAGGAMLPLLIFSAAQAGVPLTPINYRLSPDAIRSLIHRLTGPLVIVDSQYQGVVSDVVARVMESGEFLAHAATTAPAAAVPDPDSPAVVLFTSGTTSRPKAVELSHNNLTSYVMGTVEFASAEPGDAALICVPPYHIAGVGAALTNLYAGRTTVYQCQFDPHEWVRIVNTERVTTATVVPTMLDRIVSVLEQDPAELPTLRNLAYGGSKVALPLVRRALELLPGVGFVNAYGLTETSSTIAMLTPDDHRAAQMALDKPAAKRLGSVGRPVPGIEVQIRSDDGATLGTGSIGELFVRGAQVSGRYADIGSVLDREGWFPTKDLAMVDEDGYLFILGRGDDTIIRGGENIAPAELEDVLVEHPQVHEVAVIGVEDSEWGQIIVAVVVPKSGTNPDAEELRAHVRRRLRGSRTPDQVVFRDQLPTTATGKVLRRELAEGLRAAPSNSKEH